MQLLTSSLRSQGTSSSSNSMHESLARVSKLIPGLTSGQACVIPSTNPVRQYFPQGHLVMENFPALEKSAVLPMCPPFCLLSSHCPASVAAGSVPWRSLMCTSLLGLTGRPAVHFSSLQNWNLPGRIYLLRPVSEYWLALKVR